MILIANSCLGHHVYEHILNMPVSTPICSAGLSPKHFYRLINNFDKINFLNFECTIINESSEYSDIYIYKKLKRFPCLKVTIDNLIDVYYPHAFNQFSSIKKFNDQYFRRLDRMNEYLNQGKKPVFMIGEYFLRTPKDYYEKYLRKMLNHNQYHRIFLYTSGVFNTLQRRKFDAFKESSNSYLIEVKGLNGKTVVQNKELQNLIYELNH